MIYTRALLEKSLPVAQSIKIKISDFWNNHLDALDREWHLNLIMKLLVTFESNLVRYSDKDFVRGTVSSLVNKGHFGESVFWVNWVFMKLKYYYKNTTFSEISIVNKSMGLIHYIGFFHISNINFNAGAALNRGLRGIALPPPRSQHFVAKQKNKNENTINWKKHKIVKRRHDYTYNGFRENYHIIIYRKK